MKQVDGTSLLVTVVEDLSSEPVLKVWALDKTEKKTGFPRCQSTLSVQNGRKQFPVSLSAVIISRAELMLTVISFRHIGRSIAMRFRFRKWIGHHRTR